MHISETLRPYEETTYILVTDRLHAKFYQANKRDFAFIEKKENDRLKIGETERYSSQGGDGPLFQSKDEQLDDREALTFYKELAKDLFEQKQKKAFEKLIIVIPQNDKNLLVNELHPDVQHSLELVIPKELTRLSEDELIEKINEARI